MNSILKKILFSLNPETAHLLVKQSARFFPKQALKKNTTIKSKFLRAYVGEVKLNNPIGLAAGFDKNGEMLDFLGALGFGYLELGSITAAACNGNPKPRIFRLTEDHSLINRMGLPNIGSEAFAKHIAQQKTDVPYGINIAKTPDFVFGKNNVISGIDDFLQTFERLHYFGNYIVFNLSCPNSNDPIMFEDPKLFSDLAKEIHDRRTSLGIKKPVYIKLSPDLEKAKLKKTVEIAVDQGFDGFVLTNTTKLRPHLATTEKKIEKIGLGGLSGPALTKLADQQLRNVFEIVGKRKTLIGVGGIQTLDDIVTKFALGASLVQVYTGFIYNGPFFVKNLNLELHRFCQRIGVNSYTELVGIGAG